MREDPLAVRIVDGLARAVLRALVRLYRRHLSPRKGFSCAHAALHGGSTCSGFALDALDGDATGLALSAIRARLTACDAAARTLRAMALAGAIGDGGSALPLPRAETCGSEGCLFGEGGSAGSGGATDSAGRFACCADLAALFSSQGSRRPRDRDR